MRLRDRYNNIVARKGLTESVKPFCGLSEGHKFCATAIAEFIAPELDAAAVVALNIGLAHYSSAGHRSRLPGERLSLFFFCRGKCRYYGIVIGGDSEAVVAGYIGMHRNAVVTVGKGDDKQITDDSQPKTKMKILGIPIALICGDGLKLDGDEILNDDCDDDRNDV